MQPASVVIVQRIVPHYRLAFFSKLHDELAAHDIHCKVVYGQEEAGTVPRSVDIAAPWAKRIKNRYLKIGATVLVWQPCWSDANASDLVILEQANRLLINYPLQWRHRRVALWGHGRNFQAKSSTSVRERLKKRLSSRAHWWFAYTETSCDELLKSGVPANRITVVENSIDTGSLRTAREQLSPGELIEHRAALGIPADAPVAVFCGGMHPGKELGFLLEAATIVRQRMPQFHLLLIGDGPEEDIVRRSAAGNAWIHAIGAKYGRDRVSYLAMADIMLMPAHVGLAVIDSFVMQIPLFTTRIDNHSPELTYVVDGVNGVVSDFDARAYAGTICAYLGNASKLDFLRAGCRDSARRYTLENMVSRFAAGVRQALAFQRAR